MHTDIADERRRGSAGLARQDPANGAYEPNRGTQPRDYVVPEAIRVERWIALALFIISFLYLCLFRRYTSIEPDEGIILEGAQRILHGQVLYRDFFSYFTSGSYYLLAGLFKIFGSSMPVARTALAVYGALLSVFTYLMALRVCSRWSALLAAYLVTITCLPWRFLVLHNWDSTLWACGAIYCAVQWIEAIEVTGHRPQVTAKAPASSSALITRHSSLRWWAFATGSFVSLTTLFEQSKGAGLALGLGAGFVILAMLGTSRKALTTECTEDTETIKVTGYRPKVTALTPNPQSPASLFCSSLITRHSSLFLCAGLAWPFIVTFAYFGAHHALHQMLADWLWPLHHYSRANAVPYGYQNWSDATRRAMFGGGVVRAVISAILIVPCFVLPLLPLVAPGLLIYLITPRGRTRVAAERWRHYVLVCAAILGLLLSVIASRADILHFVYLGPVLYLMIAWLLGSGDFQVSLPHPLKQLSSGFLVLCFTFLGLAFLVTARGARFKVSTRRGRIETSKLDEVIPYTQAHVPAGSQIFVYPYRPLYYYLTATYSPTRFEYLQPGMHTRRQDEEAMHEIQAAGTPVVLFELGFNQKIAASWPNTPIQDIANDPVGDYILTHYRSCKVLKSAAGCTFLFMVRKDAPCPR